MTVMTGAMLDDGDAEDERMDAVDESGADDGGV